VAPRGNNPAAKAFITVLTGLMLKAVALNSGTAGS
jgi:hypothetical protein